MLPSTWTRFSAGRGAPAPRLWSSQPTLRHLRLLLTVAILACLTIAFLVSSPTATNHFRRLRSWLPWTPKPKPPSIVLEPDGPGFYEWETTSSFNPVALQDVASKSVEQVCAAFPSHLLEKIQPVLKTGHKMVEDRIAAQLRSVSACLDNLIIFSDTEEDFEGHHIIDIIAEIPEYLTSRSSALEAWRSGALAKNAASGRQGWDVDRFKFTPALSHAWELRPEREWYVFFEGDTYVVWDNVFRLLEKLDPDQPHYLGSPTPGEERTWFAYGGPGYVISREAMRRFVRKDWDHVTGQYLGPKLTEEYWDSIVENCCGDSALGWVLWGQNVTISGLFPLFNPLPPDAITFSPRYWCQPVLAMHLDDDVDQAESLWMWEWEQRRSDRPLLYRDLATSYFDFTNLERRDDWNNGHRDVFLAPAPEDPTAKNPHESVDACEQGCKAHENCFQWTYHLRQCRFVRSIQMGQHEDPGFTQEDRHKGWFSTWGWSEDDTRFRAGWDVDKISKWMDDRPCDQVLWVKPSTKRIY